MGVEDRPQEVFDESPQGQARRWQVEITAAKEALREWHNKGERIIKRFLDERDVRVQDDTRWNLFSANVQTQRALLYGNTPRVTVSRRFADHSDDTARVAAEILERLLNTDIEREGDSYALAIEYALNDRLLTGLGVCRLRYVVEMERVEEVEAIVGDDGVEIAAAVPAFDRKAHEDVEVDFVHWKDILWNPCRVWHEKRFLAFLAPMARKELIERFPGVGALVPLNSKKNTEVDDKKADPWDRADVWEIWDSETKRVYWYVEGFDRILDVKDDPLGLDGFFPSPRPMFANLTTMKLVPRPDFLLAQDLYDEIDRVSTRITQLERAIEVKGVYNKAMPELQRLLSETGRNELIPVDNWPMLQGGGGIQNNIEWLPLESVVNAIMVLRQVRTELMDAVYQVTGMSDIMRGQATAGGVTATEQGIKAKFGSVRMQALQDDFARFASEIQRLKAEIISKHFDAQTILERCNCQFTSDAQIAPQAVELIKSRFSQYRVEVKPEAVSFTDFAALKQERTEVIGSIAQYFSAVAPIAAQMPQAQPYLLQILQWMVSGLRGASQIEGVLDQAVTAAQQAQKQAQMNPQPPPPDPKVIAMQMKAQADMAKVQAELQADLVRTQAEVAADAEREQNQALWNVREAQQKAMLSHALRPPAIAPKPGGFP